MYRFFTILIGLSALSAAAWAEEYAKPMPARKGWKVSAGAMATGHSELLYSDRGGASFSVFPLLALEYRNFYWKGTEFGYSREVAPGVTLIPFSQVRGGLGLAGEPSALGGASIDASDMAGGYKGIDDRRHQLEAGLKAEFRLPQHFSAELEGRWGERGSSAKVLLKRGFMAKNFKWAVFPFVGGRMLSDEFVEYYFGVSRAEAAHSKSYRIQNAYRPHEAGFAGAVGASGFIGFGERWKVIIAVEGQVVSDEIMASPLVRNRGVLSGMTGIVYEF